MPGNDAIDPITTLVETVLSSSKYKTVSPDLVRLLGHQALARRHSGKEAVKAIKNKLHQVGGAYLEGKEDYARWFQELEGAAATSDDTQLKQTCRRIMSHHASTRERLSILDQFYQTLFAELPPVQSVLDIACGLNPLALPWMPLVEKAEYYACDIYQDMMHFLSQSLQLLSVSGKAEVRDVIQQCPEQEVDLALVLKALPCLEQIDKFAGLRLLQTLRAKHIIVSFPLQSLGGKGKGMSAYYEAHFWKLVAAEEWKVQKKEFSTELVFIIEKALPLL